MKLKMWKLNVVVGVFLIVAYFILESLAFASTKTEEELAQAAASNQYIFVLLIGIILVAIGVYRKFKG